MREITEAKLATHSTPVRGSLTVVESRKDVPFAIERLFYIYGASKNSERGAHAHREAWQAFIAIKGCFCLELTDGHLTNIHKLSDPDHIIVVPPMIWARLFQFSKDAVCLVLASSLYDPQDYVREWDDFIAYRRELASLDQE
jgi:hypothetical protein